MLWWGVSSATTELQVLESEQFLGQQAIFQKLSSFGTVSYEILTCDVQPSANDGIVAFVCGKLSIEGDNPMMFSQVFFLQKGGP